MEVPQVRQGQDARAKVNLETPPTRQRSGSQLAPVTRNIGSCSGPLDESKQVFYFRLDNLGVFKSDHLITKYPCAIVDHRGG